MENNFCPDTLSGNPGHDAKPYQEREVRRKIEEAPT